MLGWISSHPLLDSKNDFVEVHDRVQPPEEEGIWYDNKFLLEDGTHEHC